MKEQMQELRREGLTLLEIARKFGVSYGAVYYWVNPKYRKHSLEYGRERSKNPEVKKRHAKQSREYRQRYPERVKQQRARYRENNKDRIRASYRKWVEKNRNQIKENHKRWREKIRHQVIEHYSNGKMVCACCGENQYEFLTIDHLDGNGRQHRNKIHYPLYHWLVKNNFPSGFQVLCYNCNCAKGKYGICPHEIEKEKA